MSALSAFTRAPRSAFTRACCPAADKHLAVTWEDALYIYDTGKELGLTHMAGSSVPVCFWRDPWLEHPIDTPLEEAIVISYGHLEACASSRHQTKGLTS